jgi:hypothetical protein
LAAQSQIVSLMQNHEVTFSENVVQCSMEELKVQIINMPNLLPEKIQNFDKERKYLTG